MNFVPETSHLPTNKFIIDQKSTLIIHFRNALHAMGAVSCHKLTLGIGRLQRQRTGQGKKDNNLNNNLNGFFSNVVCK